MSALLQEAFGHGFNMQNIKNTVVFFKSSITVEFILCLLSPLTWPEHDVLVQHLPGEPYSVIISHDIKNATVAIQSRRIFW